MDVNNTKHATSYKTKIITSYMRPTFQTNKQQQKVIEEF